MDGNKLSRWIARVCLPFSGSLASEGSRGPKSRDPMEWDGMEWFARGALLAHCDPEDRNKDRGDGRGIKRREEKKREGKGKKGR